MRNASHFIILLLLLTNGFNSSAQGYWEKIEKKESTLGIAEVYQKHTTPSFYLKLVKASQTVATLSAVKNKSFDFTPGDRLEVRDKDGLYHLGDLNLAIRQGDGSYIKYSSAQKRAPVSPLPTSATVLAAADLRNTFPKDMPLRIHRYYELIDKQLIMRFEITNPSTTTIEIGALGIPMVFNNILEGKSLTETHAQNVFFDPYIGMDAGYLEVKKLTGRGPVLLVLPHENMPFEAYRPLVDDPSPRSIVFEGFHEWMSLSKAYAEHEWKGVKQWNTPSAMSLSPGEVKNFSLRFVLTEDIRSIPTALASENIPVATAAPGYVIPQDIEAQLFLKHQAEVSSMTIEPKDALSIKANGTSSGGQMKYLIKAKKWGRAKLTVTYSDGLRQTINYKVIQPETTLVKNVGNFLLTEQWYDDPNDPFNRTPAVISYDYEKKEKIIQDQRAWISGLSDEGGAGSWLAAVMKQLIQPDKTEILKLQRFIDETLWGGIQYKEGAHKFGVKKSLFYYEPDSMPKGTYRDDINFKTWAAWDHKHANDPGRSYNYPHVAAAYWVMYRLARYHENLVDNRSWEWYLTQAYETVIAMVDHAPYYAQFGQMEGSVFLYILEDLKRENRLTQATDLELEMKKRADHWRALDFPFGSEMPWDSTGQEEVYMWSDYFGYDRKANITLNAILAYMPTMPHWAYNGNARRYWDFLYGGKAGKTSRVERQIHHYGSSLNAIPVLKEFRKKSDDLHLLKVGYGGLLGGISNITQDGFGPAAFHSYPSTLANDGISGDYGSGFYGYAVNTATYITKDKALGWMVFGGNTKHKGDVLTVSLTTAAKSRIYFAPKALWITLDAGKISSLIYDESTDEVRLVLEKKDSYTPNAYLRINPSVTLPYGTVRGAYKIPLSNKKTSVSLN